MVKNLFILYFLICVDLIFSLFVSSCSSTPLPGNASVDIPEDFFGIVHAGSTETPEEYELLDKMEVKWILQTFYWSNIESIQDRFDFSSYDSYVDTARGEDKKVVAVLAYETPWLVSEGNSRRYISPGNIPYFLNFVEETVRHFKGRVDAWSIWNEPNFAFWSGTNKEFFELSRLTAQRIRETDNDAYILGGAFWRAPAGFIKNMYKAGAMENIDALAFHPYAVNPSGSMKVYDKFLKVLSEINYHGPIWITEVGYPTGGWYPTRVSQEELPSYVIKTIAGAAARGARTLLWYALTDAYNEGEVPDPLNSEHYFGLVYPDYRRKNGAWAYELCARFLPGSRYTPEFPKKENIPGNIVSFCFLGGVTGNNTLILWNDKNKTQTVYLSLSTQAFLHNISTGESRPLPAGAALDIEKQPLFITWQGAEVPRIIGP